MIVRPFLSSHLKSKKVCFYLGEKMQKAATKAVFLLIVLIAIQAYLYNSSDGKIDFIRMMLIMVGIIKP